MRVGMEDVSRKRGDVLEESAVVVETCCKSVNSIVRADVSKPKHGSVPFEQWLVRIQERAFKVIYIFAERRIEVFEAGEEVGGWRCGVDRGVCSTSNAEHSPSVNFVSCEANDVKKETHGASVFRCARCRWPSSVWSHSIRAKAISHVSRTDLFESSRYFRSTGSEETDERATIASAA